MINFSISKFWEKTPIFIKKLEMGLHCFFTSITGVSIINILSEHDVKLFSKIALLSLLATSIIKAISECLYQQEENSNDK